MRAKFSQQFARVRAHDGIISGSIGMMSRMAAQLCLLAVTLTATRLLKIGEFGIYSIAASLMVLSRNLFYVGPYEYLLKTPERPGLRGACLKANLLLAAFAVVMLLLFSLLAQFAFHGTRLPALIARLAPSLFLSAITAWYEALLLRGLAIRRYYSFTVIGEVVATITSIGFFAMHFGVYSLIVQIYARLVVLILLYVKSLPNADWRSGNAEDVRRIVSWSWSRFGAVMLNFSGNYGADFVLGIALSPAATGIYRASNRIVSAISDLFAQPLQKIVQTNLSARTAAGLPPDQTWVSMLLGVAAIGWATLIGLGVAASVAVPAVLGPAWTPAVPVVMVFCYMRALSLIDVTTTCVLVCCDRQRFMLVVQVVVAVTVPLASLAVATHVDRSPTVAPLVVAALNALIMSGLTLIYGREAIRLSGSRLPMVGGSLLLALTPGLWVGIFLATLAHFNLFAGFTPRLALAAEVICAIFALCAGLLLIRKRLLASIAMLGSPDHAQASA